MKRTVLKKLLQQLGLFSIVRRMACEVYTLRQSLRSAKSIKRIYQKDYHFGMGYGSNDIATKSGVSDQEIKDAHAEGILSVLPLKKIVVGGCSSGMAVRAFRKRGIEAFGFDVSPELDEIVLADIREYVRSGSMTAIPFAAEDGIDALVTTDVLEHVQLQHINFMMREMARLECPWMVHLINYNQIQRDHMTLKPLSWWRRKFHAVGYELQSQLKCAAIPDKEIYGLTGDEEHEYTFWKRVA